MQNTQQPNTKGQDQKPQGTPSEMPTNKPSQTVGQPSRAADTQSKPSQDSQSKSDQDSQSKPGMKDKPASSYDTEKPAKTAGAR